MSLWIDLNRVTTVLLADGWHHVTNDSFDLDAYEFQDDDVAVSAHAPQELDATVTHGVHRCAAGRDVVLTRLQDIPEVRSTQTMLIFEEATPGDVRRDPPASG